MFTFVPPTKPRSESALGQVSSRTKARGFYERTGEGTRVAWPVVNFLGESKHQDKVSRPPLSSIQNGERPRSCPTRGAVL